MGDPTLIFSTPWDRNRRLRELMLDTGQSEDARAGLLEVVKAAVAGRANSTDNNARSSAGYNAWDYGVRRLREVYRGRSGWSKYEEDGVEGIINHGAGLKLSVVATDSACDPLYSPRNRTKRDRPATEKIIDLSVQTELFGMNDKIIPTDNCQFWELCIADDGNEVLAELSRPVLYVSNNLLKFSERIFLIDHGEWDEINVALPDDDTGPEFDPSVRRK